MPPYFTPLTQFFHAVDDPLGHGDGGEYDQGVDGRGQEIEEEPAAEQQDALVGW